MSFFVKHLRLNKTEECAIGEIEQKSELLSVITGY